MINLSIPQVESGLRPRITVVGVGGAGGNAVNNMIRANLEGVEFVVANTDAQALAGSLADRKLQLGVGITQGLGAGSRPDVGRAAAEEAIEQIDTYLDGSHMVFITAGMGGGTGTGAAPVIARAARERGILTVGVVTKPFHFEGAHRMRTAEQGLQELQQFVDTLIIIPNQNLFRIATEKTTFADAFKMADEVLHSGVRGVTDLMVMPGLINLDFADIRTVMAEMGKAMMGTGEAEGDRRSLNAAEAAISNPLLDDVSMKGAKGVLINITGGLDMTLYEVDEATNRIRDEVDPDANIIFGSTFDEAMEGRVRVSVVATGIDVDSATMPRPQTPTLTVVGRAAGQAAAAARPATMGSYAPMMEARPTVGSKPAQPVATAQQPVAVQAATLQQPAIQQPQVEGSSALAYESALEATAVAGAMAGMAAAPEPAVQRTAVTTPEPAAPRAPERPAMTATQPVPQGLRTSEGSFIPPQPIQAPAKPAASVGATMPKAEPFADAAFANAGAQPQRKSGGLFRRVTGLLREEQVRSAPATPPAAPTPAAPRAETQPAPRQSATQPPLLPGIEATHVPTAKSDDDALEIPAFLRRQAN